MTSKQVRLISGFLGLFIASIASAGIDVVLSPSALKSNGTVDWSALGPAMTWLRPPQTLAVTGIPGLSLTATMPNVNAEFIRQDPGNKWNNYFPAGSKMPALRSRRPSSAS